MPKYFLIPLVFLCFAADADIFKWVDDNGKIHYSDKEVTGAKQVELPEAVTYTPTSSDTVTTSTAKPKKKNADTSISIIKPMMNETIRDNSGNVEVQMAIKPRLMPGYTVTIHLDGNEISKGLTQGSTTLSNLERGSHTIRASVLNKNGVSLFSSKSVIFHLRKEVAKESNDSSDEGEADKPGDSNNYKKDLSHDYDSSGTYEDGANKYKQGTPSNSGNFKSGGSAYSPNYNK